jgi:hypothetical protein
VHCAAGAAALLRVAVAATSSTSAETLVSKRLMERCSSRRSSNTAELNRGFYKEPIFDRRLGHCDRAATAMIAMAESA